MTRRGPSSPPRNGPVGRTRRRSSARRLAQPRAARAREPRPMRQQTRSLRQRRARIPRRPRARQHRPSGRTGSTQRAPTARPSPTALGEDAIRRCRPTTARRAAHPTAAPRSAALASPNTGRAPGSCSLRSRDHRRYACANSITTLMSSGCRSRARSYASGTTRRVMSCSSHGRSALARTCAAR